MKAINRIASVLKVIGIVLILIDIIVFGPGIYLG